MSDRLLAEIVERLSEHGEVSAVWLAGSRGRGTNDELSDIDIWVAVEDAILNNIVHDPLAYVRRIVPAIMHMIAPEIAPEGGAFIGTWVSDREGFTQVDWYLTPASTATRASDTTMVFGNVPTAEQDELSAVDGGERQGKVHENLVFALQMTNNVMKHARRGNIWTAIDHVRHADRCVIAAKIWLERGSAPTFLDYKGTTLPSMRAIDTESLHSLASGLVQQIENIARASGLNDDLHTPVSALRDTISRWQHSANSHRVTESGLHLLPEAEYYASLPRRRVGAGVLVTNAQGDILLLETTYKPEWEIPGGHAEAGESPRMAAAREVIEEIGLAIAPGDLLVVQHIAAEMPRGDILVFVYDGGVIANPAEINIDRLEIRAAHFVPLTDVHRHMTPAMTQRLHAAMRARSDHRVIEIGSDMDGDA